MNRAHRIVLLAALMAGLPAAPLAGQDGQTGRATSFSGEWDSTYGLLRMKQVGTRVTGSYRSADFAGRIEGTVEGNRLTFTYTEPDAAGTGWFELNAAGTAFEGSWRAKGDREWSSWTGARRPSPPPRGPWQALYQTNYGPVRLFQAPGSTDVTGVYSYEGSSGELSGRVEGRRLTYTWREGDSQGEGWFELSPDQARIQGAWRGGRQEGWTEWTGARAKPRDGVVWLMVLESQWEEKLAQQEYSFGAMLRSYFRRYPKVQVRHRRFGDRADFVRAAREVAFLPEPVLLVVASHGERGALLAGPDQINASEIGTSLARTPNLLLLHFSSCEMMLGSVVADIRAKLTLGQRLPISGYSIAVDWSASALLEFLYFDLVLGRGLTPSRAAEVVRRELRFAGDRGTPGSPLGGARFRFDPGPRPVRSGWY